MTDGTTGNDHAERKRVKGGRPRLHPEGGRRPQLAFRVRGETYDRLKSAAEAVDRSISEEIESIVVNHFERIERMAEAERDPAVSVGELIKQALRLAALSAGASFYESDKGYEAAMAAIKNVMDLMKAPEGYKERKDAKKLMGLGDIGKDLWERTAGDLESERARAIGWAAASQAVRWRKGLPDDNEPFEMLLSGGQLYEPGYDIGALRVEIKEQKKEDKSRK